MTKVYNTIRVAQRCTIKQYCREDRMNRLRSEIDELRFAGIL